MLVRMGVPCQGDGRPRVFAVILLVVIATILAGCNAFVSARPVGPPVNIAAPLGLPAVPFPAGNPPTASTIALGRQLFYDTRLSKDNSVACSSCHDPVFGFRDARQRSLGVGGSRGLRHAPTLVNVAYDPLLFWDGHVGSLEKQVDFPIADPLEMNQAHKESVAKLRGNPAYKAMFLSAFGSDAITMPRVENALASFERTILSGDSPFDQYRYQGRQNALSQAQVRGLAIFMDPHRGNCAACHTVGSQFALFTDGKFHNTGEGAGDNGQFDDTGRYQVTHVESDKGSFKTPTLRNVAMTGPYMHDGKLKTLKDVVDFYAGKGNSNPYLDPEMAQIQLSGQDREDLVKFMESLTAPLPANVGPPREGKQ